MSGDGDSQVTASVRKKKPPRVLNTLLGHCVLRALVHEEGGVEAANAKYADAASVAKWDAVRLVVKVTPKASRVATFIALWAIAMRIEGLDEFSITEYQRYWNENERKAYRVQVEFRELWPEFENPNELARQLVGQIDRRADKKAAAKMPLTLQVEA